jgi:hypothetical protein
VKGGHLGTFMMEYRNWLAYAVVGGTLTTAILAAPVAGKAAAVGMDDTPITPVSELAGLKFIRLDKLPAAPGGADTDACSSFIVQPSTPAGRLVAARGWSVTGEAKVGMLQAVSFAGSFEQGTSGTCTIGDGNVAIFDNDQLIAIAYAERSSNQSIGRIVGLENGGARVWDGDFLSTPIGDIELTDDSLLRLGKLAREETLCGGKAVVPNIYNMPINKARAALSEKGWTPVAGEPKTDPAEFGREIDLIKQGIVEVDSCSGTGLAYCGYKYRGPAGTLSVTTAGENDLPSVVGYEVNCQ